tara:strand:- start:224 stop:682 length:459 start_codon:yes stop_codon:yes gene_type:complete
MTEAEIEQKRRGLIRRMALASTALASPALARDECVLPVEAPNPLVPGRGYDFASFPLDHHMDDLREVIARGIASIDPANPYKGALDKTTLRDADAALAAIKQAGFVVVPAHASPKMAEAGLFANENALLMSAGAGDMMNAYRAMIEASNEPT